MHSSYSASGNEALIVTYQVSLPVEEMTLSKLEKVAQQIAVGQTIGTANPVEMERLQDYLAEVVSIEPVGNTPVDGLQRMHIQVAFPVKIVESDLGTLLTVIFGKLSMAGRVRVVEIQPPQSLIDRFAGPRFGIEGIRTLTGVSSGPLLMSIFKPCLGLPESTLAEMLYTQSLGGVNLVKDDEILSDADFDTARRRLAACLQASEKAQQEGGNKVLYALNLTGPAETLLERARQLVKEGATALLFNYLSYGLPMLSALRRDPEINIPLVAHPALAGAFYGSDHHGFSPQVLFGTLPRLAGADLVLFPSPYGSVALPFEEAIAVKTALTKPYLNLNPTFPVPSAGITAEMAGQMIRDFGNDVVINAGTGIYDHPDGALGGVRAFVQEIQQHTTSVLSA